MSADPSTGDAVTTFYSDNPDYVWERTDTEARIEGAVLRKVLADHLPPTADVVDIGGGNGRYAFELAAAGYRVRMCDLTPALVEDAQRRDAVAEHQLDEIVVADARRLPWPTASADVALLLGPMYCLTEERDRVATLREMRRVLRPGGIAFLQFFSRVGGLRSLMFWAFRDAGIFDWQSYLETGIFTGESIPNFHRNVHYWHSVEQIEKEFAATGVHDVDIYGMDGPAPESQELISNAPDELVDQWVDISMHLSQDRRTLNCSNHLLAVVHIP